MKVFRAESGAFPSGTSANGIPGTLPPHSREQELTQSWKEIQTNSVRLEISDFCMFITRLAIIKVHYNHMTRNLTGKKAVLCVNSQDDF